MDENRAAVEAERQHANCLAGIVQDEVDAKAQAAEPFLQSVLDIVRSWDYRSTLRNLTCGISLAGEPVACLG